MKPIDVTSDSYAEYNEGSNGKDTNIKVGEHCQNNKTQKHFC